MDGAKEFARIVGEKTGGAITVQYYPADQLTAGNQTDGIQALMDGTTGVVHALQPDLVLLRPAVQRGLPALPVQQHGRG